MHSSNKDISNNNNGNNNKRGEINANFSMIDEKSVPTTPTKISTTNVRVTTTTIIQQQQQLEKSDEYYFTTTNGMDSPTSSDNYDQNIAYKDSSYSPDIKKLRQKLKPVYQPILILSFINFIFQICLSALGIIFILLLHKTSTNSSSSSTISKSALEYFQIVFNSINIFIAIVLTIFVFVNFQQRQTNFLIRKCFKKSFIFQTTCAIPLILFEYLFACAFFVLTVLFVIEDFKVPMTVDITFDSSYSATAYYYDCRYGYFGACAVFSAICTFLYIADGIIYSVLYHKNRIHMKNYNVIN